MSEATGHGMGRDPVVPDWPPIELPEAKAVLQRWDIEGVSLRWRSPRPFSAAAIVGCREGHEVFLKRHDQRLRPANSLRSEHAFEDHLRGAGVAVPEVLRTGSGDSVVGLGQWSYELLACAPGEDRYREALSWSAYANAADAFQAGVALARLHNAAEVFELSARPEGILIGSSAIAADADPIDAIAAMAMRRPGLAAWLEARDWRSEIGPLLEQWPPAPPAAQWGHGDWHPSNLTWGEEGVVAVLDFGLSNRIGATFDLAVALERATIGWLELAEGGPAPVDRSAVSALLEGYRSEAVIDVEGLVAAMPLCHLDLALSEVEYFSSVVGSEANAVLAWESYACGHLRWWSTPAGRKFLDELASSAA